jgi:16S rRNA processing protein RimM
VEEWQRTTDTEAIIKCQDINTVDSAEDFVALDVLLHKSGVKRKKGNLDVSIIGYRIFADGFGEIGILNEIIEMPGQTMLQTFYKDQEVLIPAVEEFVIEINNKQKQITLNLPAGFLDLNAK